MNNINYIQIIKYIKDFSISHKQVKRFESDFVEQLTNYATGDKSYPLLYASPRPSFALENDEWTNYTLDIVCLDLIQKDRSNINNVLNNTSLILNDLNIYFSGFQVDGIEITGISNLEPLNNHLVDYDAGWKLTISIEVENSTLCDIPFNPALGPSYPESNCKGYERPNYLTCETLQSCSTFNDLVNRVDVNETTINDILISVIDLSNRVDITEEDIIDLQTQINNISSFTCDDLVNCQTIIDIISNIDGIEVDLVNLESIVTSINTEINNINASIDNIETNIDTLNQEVIDLQTQINNISSFTCDDLDTCQTIIDIQNGIINNESDINSIQTIITSINNSITNIETDITNLGTDIGNNTTDITTINSSITTINSTLVSLQNQIDNIPSGGIDCDELLNCPVIQDIEQDIANNQTDITTINSTLVSLQNQIDNIPSGGIDCDELLNCPVIQDIEQDIADNQTDINILKTNEIWTIELMDSFDIIFYAPYNLKIDTIDILKNIPTLVIKVNGIIYINGTIINTVDEIEITSDIATVINLNITK